MGNTKGYADSLFDWISFRLGCKVQYGQNYVWTYFRCAHVFIVWISYERQNSYICSRYSKPSNKYLKFFWPKRQSKDIVYLNASKLHAYAMYKFLSMGRLKWIDPKELELNKYSSNNSKDCFLEVGLEYPWEIHMINTMNIRVMIEMLDFSNYSV